MAQSVLNKDVSCFASCDSVLPKTVNLLGWLTSDKYWDKVEELRRIQDESHQKNIKKTLPAITPSGRFEYRSAEHLTEHSGLLTFDIDFTDNQHITNFQDMRNQLSNIPNVAYCGLSVRGKGFWGVVPIPQSTPETHSQRFQALERDFNELGIVLDPSCKDVCRLRIYSWDYEAYFNHNAKLYTKVFVQKPKKSSRPTSSVIRDKVERIIGEITNTGTDITGTYEEWFKIACSLANEFGESGKGYFHNISKYHPEYTAIRTDRMYDDILKHEYKKISIGSFFHVAQDYGIKCTIQEHRNNGVSHRNTEIPDRNIRVSTRVKDPLDNYAGAIGIPPVALNTGHKSAIKPGPWSSEIEELQKFFDSVRLPSLYRLDQCTKITNIPLFLDSHFSTVLHQNGNHRYLPYLERLKTFKKSLEDEQAN